jgi:hypothetical protein
MRILYIRDYETFWNRYYYLLTKYFVTEKVTKLEEVKPILKDIEFFGNSEAFKNLCANKKLCLIGFLDARSNDKSMKSFDYGINVLEKVLADEKMNQYEVGWLNATCHVMLY